MDNDDDDSLYGDDLISDTEPTLPAAFRQRCMRWQCSNQSWRYWIPSYTSFSLMVFAIVFFLAYVNLKIRQHVRLCCLSLVRPSVEFPSLARVAAKSCSL